MLYHVTVGGRTFDVDLGAESIQVDGTPVTADLARVGDGPRRSLIVDGRSYALVTRRSGSGAWTVLLRGRRLEAEVVDERTRAIREMTGAAGGATGPKPIRAPMPGLVVKVEVAEGDPVHAGQGVVIVEAMKMENELKAEAPGVVSRILVAEGDAVEKDQILIEMASGAEG